MDSQDYEQRRIVAYLDVLSERVNALRRLQGESQVGLFIRGVLLMENIILSAYNLKAGVNGGCYA